MADREKVIKGLSICRHKMICQETCMECPYIYDKRSKQSNCERVLHDDALALLKEQEAEWVYGEDETGVDGWRCSECNFFEPWFYEFDDDIDFIKRYEHCPKCGRRMASYTGKQKGRIYGNLR